MIAEIYHQLLWAPLTQILVQKNQIYNLFLSLNILCHLQKLNHSLQRNAACNRLLAQLSQVETFLQEKCSIYNVGQRDKKETTKQTTKVKQMGNKQTNTFTKILLDDGLLC